MGRFKLVLLWYCTVRRRHNLVRCDPERKFWTAKSRRDVVTTISIIHYMQYQVTITRQSSSIATSISYVSFGNGRAFAAILWSQFSVLELAPPTLVSPLLAEHAKQIL